MKKLAGLVLALVLAQTAFAQDIIQMTNGQELKVKIKEVNNTEVVYQPFADSSATEQRLAMDQIKMIKLEQGKATPELFKNLDKSQYVIATGNAEQNRLQGKADARRLYKGRGAMWGTFAATSVFPPAGLLTGAILAATPPKTAIAGVDPNLINDPNYREGFRKQAHNKKAGKAAIGFGMGLVGYVVLYVGIFVVIFLTWG